MGSIKKERKLKKAYRECIYAINNRILINENLFFWKEELEITELLEKDTLEIFSRFIEFGRIREAEKIIDKLFAKCIREHANIYSLYNAIIQLFFCPQKKLLQRMSGALWRRGDISCLILKSICINSIQRMS